MKWIRRVFGFERRPPRPAEVKAAPARDVDEKAEARKKISRFSRVVSDYQEGDEVLLRRVTR